MNWAWRQPLAPTHKLVLMALADAADDHGVCWPSVSTLARKCSVSTRTVQRALRVLMEQRLLVAEPRRRSDGSSTSNRYRVLLTGDDRLSAPREAGDTRAGHGCLGAPVTRVTPGTTNESAVEPPPRGGDGATGESVAVEDRGGDEPTLEYPKGLLPSEHEEAKRRIAHLPRGVGQELLDELSARLKAGTIRVSPLVYLLELIKRADAGTFAPKAGLRVADVGTKQRYGALTTRAFCKLVIRGQSRTMPWSSASLRSEYATASRTTREVEVTLSRVERKARVADRALADDYYTVIIPRPGPELREVVWPKPRHELTALRSLSSGRRRTKPAAANGVTGLEAWRAVRRVRSGPRH